MSGATSWSSFPAAADLLLFGRVTYQGMADYWQTAQGEVARLKLKLVGARPLRSGCVILSYQPQGTPDGSHGR